MKPQCLFLLQERVKPACNIIILDMNISSHILSVLVADANNGGADVGNLALESPRALIASK